MISRACSFLLVAHLVTGCAATFEIRGSNEEIHAELAAHRQAIRKLATQLYEVKEKEAVKEE